MATRILVSGNCVGLIPTSDGSTPGFTAVYLQYKCLRAKYTCLYRQVTSSYIRIEFNKLHEPNAISPRGTTGGSCFNGLFELYGHYINQGDITCRPEVVVVVSGLKEYYN